MSDGAPRLSPTMASRTLQALAFIEFYYGRHGIGPSMGEIAAGLNCNRMRAMEAVHRLAAQGRIHRVPGVARSIRPLSAEEEEIRRLRQAGYVVTKSGLPPGFVLDHLPSPHGQEEEAGRAAARSQRSGGQAAH